MERVQELNNQGKSLYAVQKYEEAINYYNLAIEEDPMFIDSYFNIGEAYVMVNKFEEAKKSFNNVLLIDKNNGLVYFHLGNIAFLEDNFNDGRAYYAKAINLGFTHSHL